METTRFVLLTASLVAFGSLTACGGDDTTTVPDASTDTSNPPNDSGGGNDVSNPPNDGSVTDAPVTGDGGTTPGTVQCGTNTCNVPAQVCCVRFQLDGGADGGAGVTRNCTAPNACQNGATTECDEKADCPGSEVCCLQLGSGSITGKCQQGCGIQGIQLCKTTTECTNDGGVCTSYTCPGNNVVQTCRKPLACN